MIKILLQIHHFQINLKAHPIQAPINWIFWIISNFIKRVFLLFDVLNWNEILSEPFTKQCYQLCRDIIFLAFHQFWEFKYLNCNPYIHINRILTPVCLCLSLNFIYIIQLNRCQTNTTNIHSHSWHGLRCNIFNKSNIEINFNGRAISNDDHFP